MGPRYFDYFSLTIIGIDISNTLLLAHFGIHIKRKLCILLQADLLNVKDAICSAMDVMQAMASSICLLSPKVYIFIFY